MDEFAETQTNKIKQNSIKPEKFQSTESEIRKIEKVRKNLFPMNQNINEFTDANTLQYPHESKLRVRERTLQHPYESKLRVRERIPNIFLILLVQLKLLPIELHL